MAIIKNTMKEQVYIELKNRILNREYEPGSPLNIVHLSKELGVSNSPIREAFAMLENEGLITDAANSKFKVVVLDEERIQKLNAAIVTLLIGATRICMKENKIDTLIIKLSEVLEQQKQWNKNINLGQKYRLAIAFDKTFVDTTENELLIKAFDNWSNLLYLSTALMDNSSNNSILEHERILLALQHGTLDDIIRELETHYDKHIV